MDTIHAKHDGLDTILDQVRLHGPGFDGPHLTAERFVIDTENSKMEITASDGSVEIHEVQE